MKKREHTGIGYVDNVDGTQIQQENTADAPETERPRQASYMQCSAGVSPKRLATLVSWALMRLGFSRLYSAAYAPS